jgi:homoserine kinase type II
MEVNQIEMEGMVAKYPVGKLISFKRIEHGFQNYSFFVTTEKGRFVLRIGKETKKEKDILFEIDFVNSLKGLPVPRYVKDREGNYVNKYDELNYVMYDFLKGNMPAKVGDDLLRQVARFLARFHKQSIGAGVGGDRFAWYSFDQGRADDFESFLLQELGEHEHEIKWMKKEVLRNRLPATLPSGAIHCDVKRHNLLAAGGRLTGVVDFDNCQVGPLLLDLAISITWFCTTSKGLGYRKVRRFVKEYERCRKLTRLEKRYLFQAIKYAYVSHEYVDFYVYAKKIISQGYFEFGRNYFLNAARRMDRREFSRRVESRFSFLFR